MEEERFVGDGKRRGEGVYITRARGDGGVCVCQVDHEMGGESGGELSNPVI